MNMKDPVQQWRDTRRALLLGAGFGVLTSIMPVSDMIKHYGWSGATVALAATSLIGNAIGSAVLFFVIYRMGAVLVRHRARKHTTQGW